jgi:hypothetical protein
MTSSRPLLSLHTRSTFSSSSLASMQPVDGVVSFLVAASSPSRETVLVFCAALILRASGLHAGDTIRCDTVNHKSAHTEHFDTCAEQFLA